jgi:hypothetical protein
LFGNLYSPNTFANGIMIKMHSMECYFQWQLSQYSDSLEARQYVVFISRSIRLPFYPEHQTSPAVHLASYSVDVVDPSPMLKQLVHEADHSPQFSAEVTDQCSCNCASAECLHAVHRDDFTFYMDLILSRSK